MEEMTVQATGDSEVTVAGNIKSIEDYQASPFRPSFGSA